MTGLLQSIPFILLALVGVTIIDTGGAIASRRLNFNYGYLTIFSLTVYTLMGYHVSGVAGITMVLSSSLVVGFYDATVGWKLSKFCRAN